MSTKLQALNITLPMGSLDAYLVNVQRIPLLTRQQELALAERWHEHQDIEAARQLVMAHLRFVVSVAKGYIGYGLALADLIQEGNIGLMKAVKRFNPQLGVRLVSFAVHWIKAEINEFVIRNWRIVKIATTKAQRKLFFKLRSAEEQLGSEIPAEASVIADHLGVKTKTVHEMRARMGNHDTDLEAAYDIADQYADPAKETESNSLIEMGQHQLLSAMDNLDERSRDILTKRWLNEDKATLQDLADHYQVSAERIRQLEKNAMNKLKQSLQTATAA